MIPKGTVRARPVAWSRYRSTGLKRLLLEANWRDAAWTAPPMTLQPSYWDQIRGFSVLQVDVLIEAFKLPETLRFDPPTGLSENLSKALATMPGMSIAEALGHASNLQHASHLERNAMITAQFGDDRNQGLRRGRASSVWMNFILKCQETSRSLLDEELQSKRTVNLDGEAVENPSTYRVIMNSFPASGEDFRTTMNTRPDSTMAPYQWGLGLLQTVPGMYAGEVVTDHLSPLLMDHVVRFASPLSVGMCIRSTLMSFANRCCVAEGASVWWAVQLPARGEALARFLDVRTGSEELRAYAENGPMMCSTSPLAAIKAMGLRQIEMKQHRDEEDSDDKGGSSGAGADEDSGPAAERCIVLVRLQCADDRLRCLPMYLTGWEASERRIVTLWDPTFRGSKLDPIRGTIE